MESPRDPLPAYLSAEPDPADPPPAVPRPRDPGESTERLRQDESTDPPAEAWVTEVLDVANALQAAGMLGKPSAGRLLH